ncbi:MAG: hypothetical protein NVSMB52_18660 [Chloroflexota bacterium]
MLGLLATKRDVAPPTLPPPLDWFNLLILDGIGYSRMIATRWKSSSNYGQNDTSVSGCTDTRKDSAADHAILPFGSTLTKTEGYHQVL